MITFKDLKPTDEANVLILFLTFILFFNNPGVIKNIFYGALKIDTLNMYTKQFTVIFSILTLFISNLYIKKIIL